MDIDTLGEDVRLLEAIRTADASRDPRAAGAARMARAFVHAETDELDPNVLELARDADVFIYDSMYTGPRTIAVSVMRGDGVGLRGGDVL